MGSADDRLVKRGAPERRTLAYFAKPAQLILRSLPLQSAIVEMTAAETATIESPADQARDAIPDAGPNPRDRFDVTRRTGRAWYLIASYI
jgi:hypothetical protein